MKRMLLGLGAVSLLALSGWGCASSEQKSADYPQWRSERATNKGDYDTARGERPADKAPATPPNEPLP